MSGSKTVNVRLRLDRSLPDIDLPLDQHVRVVVHPPAVDIIELASISFAEDREVLLPDAAPRLAEEPGPARVPAIVAVGAAVAFLEKHPEKHLLVVGHTDTVGGDKDNEALSLDRATNVFLYFAGDLQGWAAHSKTHAGVDDLQRVLAWVDGGFDDVSCDPGVVDGDMGPKTREALAGFRSGFEARFGSDLGGGDSATEEDWAAIAAFYDAAVADLVGGDTLERVRDQLRTAQTPALGLGERYPTEKPGSDDFDSERNRRVEMLFLDPVEIELLGDAVACERYLYEDPGAVERRWLPVGLHSQADELLVRVRFEDGSPVVSQSCALTTPSGEVLEATTSAEGVAAFRQIARGTCELRLPDREALDWDAKIDGARPLPSPPEEPQDEDPPDPPDITLTRAQRRVLDLDDDQLP